MNFGDMAQGRSREESGIPEGVPEMVFRGEREISPTVLVDLIKEKRETLMGADLETFNEKLKAIDQENEEAINVIDGSDPYIRSTRLAEINKNYQAKVRSLL